MGLLEVCMVTHCLISAASFAVVVSPFMLPAFMAPAFAQSFAPVDAVPAEIMALPTFVRPESGRVVRIDWASLDNELQMAELVAENAPAAEQATISLPMPDGRMSRFRIVEAPIMEPGLAAQFPAFKTYRVWGIDDTAAVGRLDVTSHGLRGMIRTSEGAVFFDPFAAQQREYESVYLLAGLTGRDSFWTCGTASDVAAGTPAEPVESPAGTPGAFPLRTYRMAMACSGEYGAYQSFVQGREPNVTDALAAIVTVVNRCNVTFEVDVGVRFLLVANNNLLAFFDPATDPYPNANPSCTSDPAADCSGGYLGTNITALNSIIGSGNFDVGHVLTRVRGGVAYLRSVCTGNKAGGVSGIPRGGELEPVSALVVLHELGHQFGGNHTFNGVLGRCNANINNVTNWEPGGGSTLLAYPGACPVGGTVGEGETDNLVLFAEPYFHTGSLMEMRSFLASGTSLCSATAPTFNAGAPVITSITPSNRFIPPSTPFALTVAATDDSPALGYSWDELDVGPAQRLTGPTSVDNGSSALFRSFPPSASPTRTFPRLPDLLAGVSYIGERMPTFIGATRKFRVTVRDNQGTAAISDIVNVRIGGTVPFVVSAPIAGQIVRGPAVNVQWNAAAIAPSPLSVTRVAITLSLDGGQTFPFVLAATAPNSGSATVPAPGLTSLTARVKVAPVDGVFFNISGSFALLPTCGADFNFDGALNPDDLADYINAFFSVPPAAGSDLNGDGTVDPDDLADFIGAFFAGCP